MNRLHDVSFGILNNLSIILLYWFFTLVVLPKCLGLIYFQIIRSKSPSQCYAMHTCLERGDFITRIMGNSLSYWSDLKVIKTSMAKYVARHSITCQFGWIHKITSQFFFFFRLLESGYRYYFEEIIMLDSIYMKLEFDSSSCLKAKSGKRIHSYYSFVSYTVLYQIEKDNWFDSPNYFSREFSFPHQPSRDFWARVWYLATYGWFPSLFYAFIFLFFYIFTLRFPCDMCRHLGWWLVTIF